LRKGAAIRIVLSTVREPWSKDSTSVVPEVKIALATSSRGQRFEEGATCFGVGWRR
jgi:hypothetical protein